MNSAAIYDSWERLESIRDDWNRLVERSATNEVFSTFEYLKAWHASNTREATPHVIVIRNGARPVAVGPLMFSSKTICGVRLKSLEFIGTPNSDYSDFIYQDPSTLEDLWREVEASLSAADILYLQQVKETSPTCRFLRSRAFLLARPCTISLSARLPDHPDAPVEAFLKAPGLRKRQVRRIEKEGAVTLDHYDSSADVKANLPVLFEQHIRRWAPTNTPSFFTTSEFRDLYMNWAEALPSSVLLSVLRLNGTPVASLFGFLYERKLVVHTITYNPDYRRFYCGLACIVKVMQALKRRGIDLIDFSRGLEGFKSYFADITATSYEFVSLESWKGRICMGLFLKAKDIAIAHESVRNLARRFGFRAEGIAKADAERPPGNL